MTTYRDAGVDIAAGDALVERIKPVAAATRRPGVVGGLGGFGALFDLRAAGFVDPVLVSTTDGVGTKLKLAIDTGRHGTVGIDLVAMCVNDLVVQGAEPLLFLDYFATGRAGRGAGRRRGRRHRPWLRWPPAAPWSAARRRRCPACTRAATTTWPASPWAPPNGARSCPPAWRQGRRCSAWPARACTPTGSPSCGASWTACGWDEPAPFDPGRSLAEALLEPTRIYVKPVLALHRAGLLRGAAHITGGGLPGNLPRALPDGTGAVLQADAWPRPPVMDWLAKRGGVSAGRDAARVQLRHRHGAGRGGRGGRDGAAGVARGDGVHHRPHRGRAGPASVTFG